MLEFKGDITPTKQEIAEGLKQFISGGFIHEVLPAGFPLVQRTTGTSSNCVGPSWSHATCDRYEYARLVAPLTKRGAEEILAGMA